MTRLLVAEDSPTQAREIELVLRSGGHEVEMCGNGRDALGRLRDEPAAWDLVVTDLTMPEMDGLELCRALRSDPSLCSIPIVLLTSVTDPASVLRGLEAGADNYLTKPYAPEALLARVRRILERGGTRRHAGESVLTAAYRGDTFRVAGSRREILDFFLSAFDDLVASRQREHEQRLAAEKQELELRHARDSRAFLQSALDALTAHIAILDEAGTIVAVNEAWRRFGRDNGLALPDLGVGASYVESCRAARGEGSDAARRMKEGIADVAAGRRPVFSLEYPCHSASERRWFLARVTRFVGPPPARVVVAHRNVTERKLAELDLAASERRYRALFEGASVALWEADVSALRAALADRKAGARLRSEPAEAGRLASLVRVLGANAEAVRLHGARDERELREDSARIFAAAIGPPLVAAMAAGRRALTLEAKVQTLADRPLDVVASIALPAAGGDPQRAIVSMTDVTALKAAEASLVDAQKRLHVAQKLEALGRLSGGIAHDFNNLLAVVLSYADFLEDEPGLSEEGRQDVERIVGAARRAASLTQQLLAFSRRQVLEPDLLSCNGVVSQLEPLFTRLIGEDVRVDTRLDAREDTIVCDRSQLEQIVMNLVVNARDAMPSGGALTIATREAALDAGSAEQQGLDPGRYVLLVVSDTGTGMTEDVLSRIFEPFFTTKDEGKGTGLGLATVYGVVHQLGGDITVESRVGRGTAFTVHLPLAMEVPAPPRPRPSVQPRPRAGTETVLVVEDDPMVRQAVERILHRGGYRVLAADGPARGLELAKSHVGSIHLLLTDIVMPGMHGTDLAVRVQRRRPETGVLFMSGYGGDRLGGIQLPPSAPPVLKKPFSAKKLLARVREALDGG